MARLKKTAKLDTKVTSIRLKRVFEMKRHSRSTIWRRKE